MAVQVTPRPLNRWPGESMALGGVRAETVQTLRGSAVWWWQAMELDEQNPLLKWIVLFASLNPAPSLLTAVDRGGGSDVGHVLELDDQQLGAIGAGAAPRVLAGSLHSETSISRGHAWRRGLRRTRRGKAVLHAAAHAWSLSNPTA